MARSEDSSQEADDRGSFWKSCAYLLSCVSWTQPLERFLPAVHCRQTEISIYVHSSRTLLIKLWFACPFYVLFEYLTTTVVKIQGFWDMEPCRMVNI